MACRPAFTDHFLTDFHLTRLESSGVGAGRLIEVRVSRWTEPSNPVDRALELAAANSFWEQRGWREALRRLRDRLEDEEAAPAPLAVAGGNAHATGIP